MRTRSREGHASVLLVGDLRIPARMCCAERSRLTQGWCSRCRVQLHGCAANMRQGPMCCSRATSIVSRWPTPSCSNAWLRSCIMQQCLAALLLLRAAHAPRRGTPTCYHASQPLPQHTGSVAPSGGRTTAPDFGAGDLGQDVSDLRPADGLAHDRNRLAGVLLWVSKHHCGARACSPR